MRRTSIQGGNLEGALLSQAMRNKKRLITVTKIVKVPSRKKCRPKPF